MAHLLGSKRTLIILFLLSAIARADEPDNILKARAETLPSKKKADEINYATQRELEIAAGTAVLQRVWGSNWREVAEVAAKNAPGNGKPRPSPTPAAPFPEKEVPSKLHQSADKAKTLATTGAQDIINYAPAVAPANAPKSTAMPMPNEAEKLAKTLNDQLYWESVRRNTSSMRRVGGGGH